MPAITCIDDLRALHRRRAPKMFYEYVTSGSWSEWTLGENTAAFDRHRLRQRVAVDLTQRSTASRMLGQDVAMPVALAPIGLAGMQYAGGEIAAARAAAAFGVPFTLSTMSICSIEDVAAASPAPFWFQLYLMRDRDFIRDLIRRAQDAGCSALVMTLDLQILGQRHADIRNGLTVPVKLTPASIANILTKPAWLADFLRTPYRQFGNVIGHARGVDNMGSLGQWSAEQLEPGLSWDDVSWVREQWDGPFVLKGIMDADDAREAVNRGADAVVVSNHGGRQLDGAPASLDALPAVVDAVGADTEVWLDGGIRSGQDVLKALALGARGTLVGRAWVHGLGALGEDGVAKALEIIRNELDLTMAFCGHTDLSDLRGVLLD